MIENVVHRYEPRGAALRLFSTKDGEVLLDGPAGTGKSMAALYRLHLACLKHKNIRCLVVRKTNVSLAATTLVTYENKVAKEAIANGTVHWYGGSQRRPPAYQYRGGSEIVVGGMDKPEKVLSSEYDLIFVDEATELTETDWETLGTRLRNGVLSWQQQIAACNPGPPSHWLNKRATVKRLISRHHDNPRYYSAEGKLTPEGVDYIEGKLGALTGVRKLRLKDGTWAAAEGLIYEDYDPAVHIVDPFPIPHDWPRYWAVDFGFTNPMVVQMWAKDPDGRLFLYREFYRTRRTVAEHCEDIARVLMESPQKDADGLWRGRWTEPRPSAVLADHDAEGRVVFERGLGIHTTPADKRVNLGIETTQERFKTHRIFILSDALVSMDEALREAGRPVCTADELTGYIWDIKPDGSSQERPRKEDDHGMDAMRYMVAEADMGRRPRYRSFSVR